VIENGDRNGFAVAGRGQDPLDFVVVRIVPGRHFLLFTQNAVLGGEIIVKDLRRRGRRRVIDPHFRGVILIADRSAERIGFFIKSNHLFRAAGAFAHNDTRQALMTLQADKVILQHIHAEYKRSRRVRDKICPVVAARCIDRRRDNLEVNGVISIGRDDKLIAPMFCAVFDVRLTRCDCLQFGRLGIGFEIVDFRCRMASSADKNVVAGLRLTNGEKEARILFAIDLGRPFAAQLVHVNRCRSALIIALDPVDAIRVRAPDKRSIGIFNNVRQIFTGLQILELNVVKLAALGIGRIGDELVVRAVLDIIEGEISLAFAHGVAIQQDLVLGFFVIDVRGGLARDDRIFAASAEAGEISVRPVDRG